MSKKDAKAYNDRGIAKEKLGKYDEAIADCTYAIALDPSNANASLNKQCAKVLQTITGSKNE